VLVIDFILILLSSNSFKDCDRRMMNYDIRIIDQRVFLVFPPEALPEQVPVVPAPVALDLFTKLTKRAHCSSRLVRI